MLELNNVKAYYRQVIGPTQRIIKAVDGVSLKVFEREIIGVVGESGSGKSTLANVIMMNIRPPLIFVSGSVKLFTGNDFLELQKLDRDTLRERIWGREIAIIPQAALNALMPTLRIRRIILDVIKSHNPEVDEEEVIGLAIKRFKEIGLPEIAINMYPFELSGGMRQRAVIAIATLLNPRLLIADEPTSALDVVTQKMVLKTFIDIYNKNIIKSIIFITHDIATVRQLATRIVVMYAGKIVEDGSTDDVIAKPLHPYTDGLMGSVLTPEEEVRKRGLRYIPGQPPDLSNPPPGCRFHPRCPFAMDVCRREEPPMIEVDKNRFVSCWLHVKR
ncbi:ABC transporter ATP-binding protein [Ignisphaera sp. 4213-co]|uniref:ABC transporter ATP-binding protein n=1 Tax=Ignisphaera cupida TaxID=3050454 RepID=A0ABD4Z4A8_9CREN|nr:ABC transporter ATP-binding protein [Ignisphaera sp. 4213-co]MDK6028146.1 ABC transporter ATP-binding protein [Ignisphaera sp. 4213-co]